MVWRWYGKVDMADKPALPESFVVPGHGMLPVGRPVITRTSCSDDGDGGGQEKDPKKPERSVQEWLWGSQRCSVLDGAVTPGLLLKDSWMFLGPRTTRRASFPPAAAPEYGQSPVPLRTGLIQR